MYELKFTPWSGK